MYKNGVQLTFRSFAKNFTPPIIFTLIKRVYLILTRRTVLSRPSWRKAVTGPLIGHDLFIEESPMGTSMLNGTYDSILFESASELLKNSKIIIDIGAHIGYHSLCFAAIAPNCNVISYEPAPVNLKLFQIALDKNADLKERIQLKPIAVGANDGELEMMISPDSSSVKSSMCYLSGMSEIIHVNRSRDYVNFEPVKVRVVALDKETAELNDRVGIVKIDVEGSEVDVIMGGKNFLLKHQPTLFIEVHSAALAFQLSSLLADLHYKSEVIDDQSRNRCVIRANPLN
jgi:FkbM family methyltransferase